jgi:hypothetical protein
MLAVVDPSLILRPLTKAVASIRDSGLSDISGGKSYSEKAQVFVVHEEEVHSTMQIDVLSSILSSL